MSITVSTSTRSLSSAGEREDEKKEDDKKEEEDKEEDLICFHKTSRHELLGETHTCICISSFS